MGIDFGVLWAPDFNNVIRFSVRRPVRRLRVARRHTKFRWVSFGRRTSKDIIEISDPNYPKIDTHNDLSVISYEFWCDGGRRVTLSRRALSKSTAAGNYWSLIFLDLSWTILKTIFKGKYC